MQNHCIILFLILFVLIGHTDSFGCIKVSPRHIDLFVSSSFASDSSDDETTQHLPIPSSSNPAVEKAWKYVKKPLLRVGAHGVGTSHGNSLRELLNAHTIVKVKVNSISLGSLEQVFHILKDHAEKAGAPSGMELLMSKASANTILIGMPGSLERIKNGEFPPAP